MLTETKPMRPLGVFMNMDSLILTTDLISFVLFHKVQIPLVMGCQIIKIYELHKRFKDPKNFDLGPNFPGFAEQSTASKDLLNKPKHTTSV